MKILVVGGSYFFGRWFVQYAQKAHQVTVLNRGTVKTGLETVTELTCDRHDRDGLLSLPKQEFDCIVDFCAYQPGDIKLIADVFGRRDIPYLFISTVDVYQKGTRQMLFEDSPLEQRSFSGMEGAYISGKVALESELEQVCGMYGMIPVSLRPSILYGPANYAPREQMYFDWIDRAGKILSPSDSESFFQLLYVQDAAQMVLAVLEEQKENLMRAYNLLGAGVDTYDSFALALHEAEETEFSEEKLPCDTIDEMGVPLPFPLFRDESEGYGTKYDLFDKLPRTPLVIGLQKSRIK